MGPGDAEVAPASLPVQKQSDNKIVGD